MALMQRPAGNAVASAAPDALLPRFKRRTGLPAKYGVPVVVGMLGLALGGVGESSDIAYHVDFGRDDSLFTVPHVLILVAIASITLAGVLALAIPGPSGRGALRVRGRALPAGGLVVVLCSAVALAAFPLDGTWHELFGEDLTLWSPTHLLLIGGPTLAILGLLLLVREGATLGHPSAVSRAAQVVLVGFLLGALTDLQAEFGFGVPQFRLLFHPVVVALTGALVLVFARLLLGRGGAVKALVVYWVVGGLALAVGLLEPDRTLARLPLYLVAALVVELVAARRWRSKLTAGAAAGLGVGTVGLAAEWTWSEVWMPIPWPQTLLPEAAVLAAAAGLAAGVIGARMAIAYRAAEDEARSTPPAAPRWPVVAAATTLIAVLAVPLSRSGIDAGATIVPYDTRPGSTRLRVALDPPDAARGADWFRVLAIHGGSTSQVELRSTGGGRFITRGRVPVGGERDAVLRLARGTTMASVTVYSRGDETHEQPTALARRTSRFEPEHALPPVGGWRADLQKLGYVLLGAIAAAWLLLLCRALLRIEGAPPARLLRGRPSRARPAR